jgi:hypothetical protein
VLRLNGDALISPSVFTAPFNNGDVGNFETNTNLTFTDNQVEIPAITRTANATGSTIKDFVIDLQNFDDAKITTITDTVLTYQTIAIRQVLIANGDINITDVGDFSRFRFEVGVSLASNPTNVDLAFDNNAQIEGVGYAVKYAVTFDSGTNWYGVTYHPSIQFVKINNINDTSEFDNKGIATNSFNTASQANATLIDNLRSGSNTLRFAYLIRRFKVDYTAYLTTMIVEGYLKGTLEPAGTSATVAYNNVTKTAIVTFNATDTFQINYIDT